MNFIIPIVLILVQFFSIEVEGRGKVIRGFKPNDLDCPGVGYEFLNPFEYNPNFLAKFHKIGSWQECAHICSLNDKCESWIYWHADKARWSKQCRIYTHDHAETILLVKHLYNNTIMGTKNCHSLDCPIVDIDYHGHDIEGIQNVLSWQDCATKCRENQDRGCRYWSWLSETYVGVAKKNTCFIKTSDAGREIEHGILSGAIDCGTHEYCKPDPCENNGVCAEGTNTFTCDCSGTGYKGKFCRKDVNECHTGAANCNENFECQNTPGSFNCDNCKSGYKKQGSACIDDCIHYDQDCYGQDYKNEIVADQDACTKQCQDEQRCKAVAYERDNGRCHFKVSEPGLSHKAGVNCVYKSCTCKTTQFGGEYSGYEAVTKSGKICQRWDVQTPHKHTRNDITKFPESSLAEANNYCRNPDNASDGPWCYTMDPEKRWESCDVHFC